MLVASWCLQPGFAAEDTAIQLSVHLDHTPVSSAVAGKNTEIRATVEAEGGIAELRLYFKTMVADQYVFLKMNKLKRNVYSTTLPPAKNDTRGIDYLIVVKKSTGEAVRSKSYRILIHNNYSYFPGKHRMMTTFSEDNSVETTVSDFALPLQVLPAAEKLLSLASFYPHAPIAVPGPARTTGAGGVLGTLGGVAASVTIGGVGIKYGSTTSR